MYVLDGNTTFGMTAQMVIPMVYAGDIPPVLIVGIGYEVASPMDVVALRARDYLPTPEPDFAAQMTKQGFSVRDGVGPGGADAFLRFIEEELKPFIAARHPVKASDDTIVGYSYGGTFAFHVLMSSPASFERYVVGSPELARDGGELIADESRYDAAHSDLPATVFLSACELDFENGILEPTRAMMSTLRSRGHPQLELRTHVFPEETHQSGIAPTISRGLRAVFGTWPGPSR